MKARLIFILVLLMACCQMSFATPKSEQDIFRLNTRVIDANHFSITFQVEPGYFLYRERIHLNLDDKDTAQLGSVFLPAGEEKHDVDLGKYQIYRKQTKIQIPVLAKKAGEATLTVHYQGCSDSGFCYPPQSQGLRLQFSPNLYLKSVDFTKPATNTTLSLPKNAQELLSSHNLTLIIAGFLILGLMLSFTPCVLPMIPIISSIIIGRKESLTTSKAFRLSFTYVTSMSLTYAFAGMIISQLGSSLQVMLQQPWILVLSALLFFALALSMFDVYTLTLPKKLEAKIAQISRGQQAGDYIGVFVMGVLASLIISPCVSAPLVGTLAYIASTGDRTLGFMALFALGFGMGLPILLIGTSAQRFVPKAGMWMNVVKHFLGVLLIAVAISLITRILPGPIGLFLWAALLVIVATYLGVIHPRKQEKFNRLFQGIGLLIFVYGVMLIIGASLGNSDPFMPLENLRHNHHTPHSRLHFKAVKTIEDVEREIKTAHEQGKAVMLDFYADWCLSCKVIERTTLQNANVQKQLNQFVLLRADITKNDATDKALLKHFGVIAPPTFLFFDKMGQRVRRADIVGEVSASVMLQHIRMAY